MAMVQNNHNHHPFASITPDPRPTTTTTTQSLPATNPNNAIALSQYEEYRSAPQLYPSYDRLRFIRLPDHWTLHTSTTNNNTTNNSNEELTVLHYWPAIIYQNYQELIRDLGRGADGRTKAQFLLLHRDNGIGAVVGRLLRWDDGLRPDIVENSRPNGGSQNGGMEGQYFPNPNKIDIVQLGQDTSIAELDSSNSTKVLSFYDEQVSLEDSCNILLKRYKGKKGVEESKLYRYAVQFQRAVVMACNCLALDIGADVYLPRSVLETPAVSSNGARDDVATTDGEKKDVSKSEIVAKKVVVQTKVQNLEVARAPNGTDNVVVTTKSKAVTKEKKMTKAAVSKSTASNTTRTESKRGGGGGTKSRPEASQTIPKKFQSASKPSTNNNISKSTKSSPTTTPLLPWNQLWKIMKSKGWTWAGPVGLMTSYRYIKPGCKIKNGQVNIDYFTSEETVQQYARNVYGWGVHNHTIESLERIIDELHTKYAGESIPALHPSMSIGSNDPWRDVWEKLRKCGWTWKAGSGLMMDYYYIKPDCTIKGGVKGEDYFERVEDVKAFVKRNYGWVGDESGVVMKNESDEGVKKLPEKRRRVEKLSSDEPVVKKKKVKTMKRKVEKVKPIREDVEMEEEEDVEMKVDEQFEEEMMSSENYGDDEEGDDDDEMSRFSEARSTYSQSGFQSKKLFVNECADENVPSLEGGHIYSDDPWSVVWKTMRKAGWTWKGGSGLMTDYYYIKPGCNVKDGEEGKDYFISEDDVKRFAERNYGWNSMVRSDDVVNSQGSDRARNLSISSDGSHFSESKPSAEEKIESKEPTKKSRNSSVKEQIPEPVRPDPYASWKILWPALQKVGWRVVKAGKYNRLHDWYYVRPDCDPGDGKSELHIDYFLTEEDVCTFARQNDFFGECVESESESAEALQAEPVRNSSKLTKSSSSKKHPSTPQGCETRPQDPAKPLLSSAKSCTSQSSSYDWLNLWPVLHAAGWRVVKASNPLHNWYYVRPNRDPRDSKTKLGRHYFGTPEDVIDFVKSLDEKDGDDKPSRKSDIGVMLKAFEEEATDLSCSEH